MARPMQPGRRSRLQGDAGAASLEYAGFLFVITLIVGSLLVYATPLGAALQARICQAVGAACGSAAAEQRASDLGVKCTISRTNRDLGYNVAVTGYRGERQDTDGVTTYGDGSSSVTMTQGSGIGVDGSSTLGGKAAQLKAKATVNGDLGYVYSFPEDLGGSEAAQDFLGAERDGLGQAVDIVLPGAQSLDEGLTRVGDGTRNFIEDRLLTPIGAGPDAEERAAREREQRATTADAITIALSLQGSAGVSIGAGVPTKGPAGQKPGTDGAGTVEGALSAGASVAAVVKGQSTIGLTTGRSDSVASSFQGSASVDLEAGVVLGLPGDVGQKDIPPFLSFAGQAGAVGTYRVVFDENGNPTQLVLVYEEKLGAKGGFAPPRLGSKEVKVGASQNGTRVTERTVILDLDDATSEGRDNRAAFDEVFAVGGVSVDGRTAKVAIPNTTDLPRFFNGWASLNDRIDRDGFIVDAEYEDAKRADEVGIKVAGTGLEGTRSSTTRELVNASLYDNRNGGTEVTLASCQAP